MLVLTQPEAYAPEACPEAESKASDVLAADEGRHDAGMDPFAPGAPVAHTGPAYEWHALAPPSSYE